MNNQKVFKITINGITESISQVDALVAKLNTLEQKINSISGVKVEATPQANTSAQQQQVQAQKQITIEVEKQNQAIQQQEQLVAQSVSINKEALAIATQILGTYDENTQKLAEYDAKLKELAASRKQLESIGVTNEQTRQYMAEIIADEVKYKQLKSETLSILKTEAKLTQAQVGSYDEMSAALGRMRDALRAGGNSLSPEQFQKISAAVDELDRGLKDADKSMGNFQRNVGNYASAADGFDKIKVTIAGTTQEFDGARTAIMSLKNAMAQLAVEGKTNTEEYEQLAAQMKNLQLAMITVNDEIDKAKSASSGLHSAVEAMQGLLAIGTIGQGFTNLFGIDDSQLTQQIQKITSLMGILQGLKELSTQIATGTGVGPALNKLLDVSGLNGSLKEMKVAFGDVMTAMKSVKTQSDVTSVAFDVMGASARAASAAVKTLWRALLVGLVIEGVVWIIEKTVDGIKALYNVVHDYYSLADDVAAANTALAHTFDLVKSSIEGYNEARDHEVARGEISQELADMEKMLNLQQQITKYAKLSEGAVFINSKNADITPVLQQYSEFEQRLGAINQKNLEGKDIADDMGALYNDVLGDLAARWLEVDKNDQKAIEGFMEWYKQAPLYQAAVKWAIDTGDDAMKTFGNTILDVTSNVSGLINEIYRLQAAANATVDYYVKYVAVYGKNASAAKARDEALAEINKSTRSESDKELARKLVEDEFRERTKAYETGGKKVVGAAKKTANDLLRAEKMLQEDRLAIMRDGLTKTLETIDIERKERLAAIDQMGVSNQKKNELIASANKRYDQKALEARKEYQRKYLKEVKEFERQLAKLQGDDIFGDIDYDKINNDYTLQLRKAMADAKVGFGIPKMGVQFTLDVVGPNGEPLSTLVGTIDEIFKKLGEEQAEWGGKITEVRTKIEKIKTDIKQLQKQIEDTRYDYDDEEEYANLQKMVEAKQRELEELKIIQEETVKAAELVDTKLTAFNQQFISGKIHDRLASYSLTYGQYQEYYMSLYNYMEEAAKKELELQKQTIEEKRKQQIEELADERDREIEALQERHENLMKDEALIKETGKTKLELEEQFENDKFSLISVYGEKMGNVQADADMAIAKADHEYLEKERSMYHEYYNDIINLQNMYLSRLENRISASRNNNTNAMGFFDIAQFRKERKEYLGELSGMIKDIDIEMASMRAARANGQMNLLDFTRDYDEMDKLRMRLHQTMDELKSDNGLEEFFKGIDEWAQKIGQAVNDVLSAVFDVRNSQFEKMKEDLDKQIELVTQKYDEMEELANKHKDNINSIEDELNTARGDRRAHLIDSLSAEIEAQRKALAAQKAAEKEKERLERQSDRLELQRKKEQKRQSLITATINAALAISQAAANKYPVPAIPLIALATAVGAAQIAAISAQQYRKGGLLQGPDHEHGGIKVGHGIEVEGGEFVTNKRTTAKNLAVLEFINSKKKKLDVTDFISFYSSNGKNGGKRPTFKTKFADGGVLNPSLEIADRVSQIIVERDDRPIYVAVTDINRAQANLRNVETLAGIQ